jgi:xanthine dehydrogenase molybdenum-binding subunit|tara:strand:+ start:2335 stop:4614 length:2280 start_codon:yes stop_codon:yes gene_type:complete
LATQTPKNYSAIGKRPVRHDGADKVTGKAQYGADLNLPGMLFGKVLRSPHAHARIKSIDLSAAVAHPDVKAIVTSSDLSPLPDKPAEVGEDLYANMKYVRDRILASDKVLFKGHPVAAIAANGLHEAEELLSLIKVEYEVLESVTDVESAMSENAPILHDTINFASMSGEEVHGSNIASHDQYILGDIDQGFKKADLTIEREYRTKTVHQGYIEPQNGTASWRSDGHVTIWCSSQGHFGIRDQVSTVLGLPVSKVTVVPMEIGGGFGGKLPCYLEPLAALLSKKTGSPVKMFMTRSEVIEASGPTSGSFVRVKIGVTNDGKITAAQGYLAFEAGAFPGSPIGGATACMLSPYDIENLQLDGYDVVDNKPKTTAYRAPGAPIGALAVETVIDEIAEELKIDPIDLRLLNAAKEGTRRSDGVVNGKIGMIELSEIVKNHDHYQTPLEKAEGKLRGRGIAFGYWRNNTGPAACVATVTPDGTVNLSEGSVDVGGSRTAISQQLAEVLSIPVEDVNPQVADTDSIGYTSVTGGSGVAFKSGWAAFEAAQEVKKEMLKRASLVWDAKEEEVEYADGIAQHKSDPELKLTFKEIAAASNGTGGPIVGSAGVNPRGVGGSFAAMLVDVEVDEETGKTTILRCTPFTDVGKAIHPDYVEGQIQGGTAQGIGWALNEEYFMSDDGKVMNASLLDYRMPTTLDLPMIDPVVVEVFNPGHPFGVRGVGESPLVPPLAAMANALYDATGVRMRELPMSPTAVKKALDDAKT